MIMKWRNQKEIPTLKTEVGKELNKHLVGEPKSRILQNDRKVAPENTAEFLYTGSLNSV